MTVVLVLLSIWVENSGLLKAGPRQAEFEPIQAKTYRFSDVHGVDEAKAVSSLSADIDSRLISVALPGASRSCRVPEGPYGVWYSGWQTTKGRPSDGTPGDR